MPPVTKEQPGHPLAVDERHNDPLKVFVIADHEYVELLSPSLHSQPDLIKSQGGPGYLVQERNRAPSSTLGGDTSEPRASYRAAWRWFRGKKAAGSKARASFLLV